MEVNIDQEAFKPEFVLYGSIDLQKSAKSGRDVKDGKENYRFIFGEITTEDEDEDGETILEKALDWKYFDKNGFIKYEHVANQPGNIIGAVHERTTTSKNATFIKGALFKKPGVADEAWELIKSIEEHNRDHPDHVKSLGYSLEGKYSDGQDVLGGMRKAQPICVVVTPKPVNTATYLRAKQDFHKSLKMNKAMEAGSGTGAEMTNLDKLEGGRAITKEKIDGEIKEVKKPEDVDKEKKVKSSKSTKRSRKMNFKTVEEAVTHFEKNGETPEKAQKLAKSLFPDETIENVSDDIRELVKSQKTFGETFTNLFKGIAGGEQAAEQFPVGSDADEIDLYPAFSKLTKSVNDNTSLVSEQARYTHEQSGLLVKAMQDIMTVQKALSESATAMHKAMLVGEGENAVPIGEAVNALIKAREGSPADLNALNISGDAAGDGSQAPTKPNFGEMQATLNKGITDKKLTSLDQSTAVTAYHAKDWKVVDSILKKAK